MFQARRALALVLASFALAFATAVAAELPKPTGPVNDFAGVLSDAAERELTELLRSLESETTAEIAVATVASLEGLPIEEYATKLFNAWGVGQAGKDNGVLVVVDPTSRSMRIEVGYGLEAILPDGLAGSIIRRDFGPAFKAGDYDAGHARWRPPPRRTWCGSNASCLSRNAETSPPPSARPRSMPASLLPGCSKWSPV